MKLWLAGIGALAFTAAIGLEIYRRTEATALTGEQAKFRQEAEWIIQEIESQTDSDDACTAMLGGLTYTPNATNAVALEYTYDNDFQGPLRASSEVTHGLILEQVNLVSAAGLGTPAAPADPVNGSDMNTQSALYRGEKLTRYPVQLQLSLTAGAMTSRQTGPSGITRPFYIWTNSAGTILSCFGRESLGAFCNSLGSFYAREAGANDRPDRACRPSLWTSAWVDGRWTGRGACRFGGLVTDATQCASRFGSGFEAMMVQGSVPTGGVGARYACMTCQ